MAQQNKKCRLLGKVWVEVMEEKTYRVMRGTGATNIAVGVVSIVVGLVVGILMIISGSKLLSQKGKIMF